MKPAMDSETRFHLDGWPLAPLLAAVGCLGALPVSGGIDPVRVLVVLALWAPAAGWACWDRRGGWLVPLAWWGVVAASSASTGLDTLRAPMAIGGLFLVGRGLGSCLALSRVRGAVLALLVTVTLAVLPGLAGVAGDPWPVGIASRLLDASPVVWVCESAGVDWMRRPGVYDTVGCDRFARASFATSWMAGSILAVGAGAALLGAIVGRRPHAAPKPHE